MHTRRNPTEELHKNINMALYGLTLKCKENKHTNKKNKYAVSEDYPTSILTTQASGVEKMVEEQ